MLLYVSFYLLALLTVALNGKALGAGIVYVLALNAFYPDQGIGALLSMAYAVAYFIASVRE